MRLSRRGLLGMLAGAMVMDPEKLLWVPGKKLISIPKPKAAEHQWIVMGRDGWGNTIWLSYNRPYWIPNQWLPTDTADVKISYRHPLAPS